MCSLSFNPKNHFFEIEVMQPKFDEVYNEVKAKTIKQRDIEELFKMQLKTLMDGGKIIEALIQVDQELKQPLLKLGLDDSQFLNYLRLLIGKGYLDWYEDGRDSGDVKITAKGHEWIKDKNYNNNLSKKEFENFNFFSISPKFSPKIKELLDEINYLPSDLDKYKNLIAHQLRTVLALSLLNYWERHNKKLKLKTINSLHKLIEHTRNNALSEGLPRARKISDILRKIKTNLTKELADDVVHCDYKTAKLEEVRDFCKYIEHLLSQVYRN